MSKEKRPRFGLVFRHGITNWSESDLPLSKKLRVALGNEWKKVVTHKSCCGNHGQPGC